MTAKDIEIAVAKHFDWRKFAIVPNISWGMNIRHEADVWVVNPKTKLVTEVEIKISSADIKLDLKKKISHYEGPVRRLFFAVPESLAEHPDIPLGAGLLSIQERHGKFAAKRIREATIRTEARPLTDEQFFHYLHLGSMRVWNLKERIQKLEKT